MGLDYSHTCPQIDKGINQFKEDIRSRLIDMLDTCCPLLTSESKDVFIEEYVENIYYDFDRTYESVRSANENMRKEADRQIDTLEIDLENAQIDLKTAEDRISELELEINTYETN